MFQVPRRESKRDVAIRRRGNRGADGAEWGGEIHDTEIDFRMTDSFRFRLVARESDNAFVSRNGGWAIVLMPQGQGRSPPYRNGKTWSWGLFVKNKEELKTRLEEAPCNFRLERREKIKVKAGTPGGQQQMLALARDLWPTLKYCADEPSLGLAPKIGQRRFLRKSKNKRKHKNSNDGG